jgi:hypothetical protein
MWNPKTLIRSWKWSNIVERQTHRSLNSRTAASTGCGLLFTSLSSGDTEVSQPILVSVCRQSALCLFPDEKSSQLILHDLEDMAEVLPDEFVLVRHSIADSSKWTAPRHAKSFATRYVRRTAVRDPPESQLHN